MTRNHLPAPTSRGQRQLSVAAYQGLADVPPEMEWFANLGNKATRRAYETALKDFMRFTGIERPKGFRTVTRVHEIAWRDELARRALSATTFRHRLSALASIQSDVATFGKMPGVAIFDMSELVYNPGLLRSILNGQGVTIGASCNSGESLTPPK